MQKTQNICITFVQHRPNVSDVGPTLYKCYTNVLFPGYLILNVDVSVIIVIVCMSTKCSVVCHASRTIPTRHLMSTYYNTHSLPTIIFYQSQGLPPLVVTLVGR